MVQQAQAPGSQALAQSYADTHTLAAITRRRSLQKMSQRHRSAHVQRLGLGLSCTNGTVRVLLSEGIGGGKQRHNTGRLRARAVSRTPRHLEELDHARRARRVGRHQTRDDTFDIGAPRRRGAAGLAQRSTQRSGQNFTAVALPMDCFWLPDRCGVRL